MRILLSLAAAGAVFCAIMTAITVGIIIAFTGGLPGAIGYLGSYSLWLCVIFTIGGFTMIGAIVDGPFMRLAGWATLRVRLRYAVAYALLTTIIPVIFFIPLTLSVRPYWIVLLTIGLGAVSGFAGGYVRGVLMDLWSREYSTDRPEN